MINILEYQYGSNKGQAKEGQVFNSPLANASGAIADYSSSQVVKETLGADLKPQWTPVVGTVYNVTKGAAANVKEDGTVEGASNNDIITYMYDNETVPVEAPEIKLNIRSLPVETRSRKLKALWSFDAAYELDKEYGQNMQDLLAATAVGEIGAEIDNEIMQDLYKIANAGPELSWSRTQPVGVSLSEHYDSFYATVVEGSNLIFGATRRAHANRMIVGLNVASVLQVMRNFEADEDQNAVGPHRIGKMGNIEVYVNPNYDPNAFVLGYKGNSMIDTGYVYAPYMPVLTTDMVTLADDFASRQGWATMYATKAINPRLYVRGHIS